MSLSTGTPQHRHVAQGEHVVHWRIGASIHGSLSAHAVSGSRGICEPRLHTAGQEGATATVSVRDLRGTRLETVPLGHRSASGQGPGWPRSRRCTRLSSAQSIAQGRAWALCPLTGLTPAMMPRVAADARLAPSPVLPGMETNDRFFPCAPRCAAAGGRSLEHQYWNYKV